MWKKSSQVCGAFEKNADLNKPKKRKLYNQGKKRYFLFQQNAKQGFFCYIDRVSPLQMQVCVFARKKDV